MIKCFVPLVAALALAGCVTANGSVTETRASYAWDGLGREPSLRARIAKTVSAQKAVVTSSPSDETEKLATLPMYSSEWWAARAQMEREADAKLSAAMIICRGCLKDTEHTGSITTR